MRFKLFAIIMLAAQCAFAQEPNDSTYTYLFDEDNEIEFPERKLTLAGDSLFEDIDSVPRPRYASLVDSLFAEAIVVDTVISLKPLPREFFLPATYVTYVMPDTVSPFANEYSGNPAMRWLEDANALAARKQRLMQGLAISNPGAFTYNVEWLPEPIKHYEIVINPDDHTIDIAQIEFKAPEQSTLELEEINKRHWLKKFDASLQFSQAYVSPNWYQGGNNNLNALLNLYYNVKLNQKYHPNLLFESTFQYKLGINSAPDDSIRNYNVSVDLLQINTILGVKAWKKWYYSLTGQFKTQIVNSYKSNTNTLRSAFLSPGELNLGLGMTYNTANPKKTFTLDVSVSPLSYNMLICANHDMDPVAFGIDNGRRVKHKFGSSGECKVMWKMTYNITLQSRFFLFTDYDRAYCDWENTLSFEINRFLTTQLFVHMRYDTDTPKVPDTNWKKLQVKEILSLGFAYKFSTI